MGLGESGYGRAEDRRDLEEIATVRPERSQRNVVLARECPHPVLACGLDDENNA